MGKVEGWWLMVQPRASWNEFFRSGIFAGRSQAVYPARTASMRDFQNNSAMP
jgi:hypothetical protein